MKRLSNETIRNINTAMLFNAQEAYEPQPLRPWQYVQMEYERVGLMPPATLPDFRSMEDAQIWMCLDSRYNMAVRGNAYPQAV